MSLNDTYNAVKAFHKAFKHPVAYIPAPQALERVGKRRAWIAEECEELEEATYADDPIDRLTEQADAYLDIIYFAVGGLVELGVMPQPLFDIVQNANMAKLHNIDGELVPQYHPDGKVKKPEGWVEPQPLIRAEIERQIAEAMKDF
jgi:predicted HAD superfamily Cof-like phosphohydrolase